MFDICGDCEARRHASVKGVFGYGALVIAMAELEGAEVIAAPVQVTMQLRQVGNSYCRDGYTAIFLWETSGTIFISPRNGVIPQCTFHSFAHAHGKIPSYGLVLSKYLQMAAMDVTIGING